MGSFNRDRGSRGDRGGFGGGRRSFGGGHSFGGRSNFGRDDRGNRQMFKVVCGNCGKDCEVPFKPTSDKPVYCSECFEKMGGRDNKRSFSRSGFGDRNSSNDTYKAQLDTINTKLDNILNLLQPKENATSPSPVEGLIDIAVEEKEIKPAKSKRAPKGKQIVSEI